MKKLPVKRNGVIVGYTDGQNIEFLDTDEAKSFIKEINFFDESFNGIIPEPTFEINEAIESDGGTWQLFKEHGSDVHQLEYWLPNGDRPQVVLNLTKEEFTDLETLFPNIKKYRDE